MLRTRLFLSLHDLWHPPKVNEVQVASDGVRLIDYTACGGRWLAIDRLGDRFDFPDHGTWRPRRGGNGIVEAFLEDKGTHKARDITRQVKMLAGPDRFFGGITRADTDPPDIPAKALISLGRRLLIADILEMGTTATPEGASCNSSIWVEYFKPGLRGSTFIHF